MGVEILIGAKGQWRATCRFARGEGNDSFCCSRTISQFFFLLWFVFFVFFLYSSHHKSFYSPSCAGPQIWNFSTYVLPEF